MYSWHESSNVCLLHESLLIRLLMDLGSCFTIAGGWFERRLMYKGSSLGFLYGLYVPSVKSSVMSKKFTRLRFAVAVIFSPNLLKVSISCFLALSASLPDVVLMAARPSSRYNPMFSKRSSSLLRMNTPTSSQLRMNRPTRQVNFLDITLDLTDGTYKPYRKPNDEPLYINRLSNHPPAIVKQLPSSINKRINKLSCNKQTFDDSSQLYNDALRQSNFNATLTYEQFTSNENSDSNRTQRRNRQRNTIWYNPPYSKNVKTNIEQRFLQLIDKHFPPSNKLHKIFNRHNVRISYSCLHNMSSFINRHNRKY